MFSLSTVQSNEREGEGTKEIGIDVFSVYGCVGRPWVTGRSPFGFMTSMTTLRLCWLLALSGVVLNAVPDFERDSLISLADALDITESRWREGDPCLNNWFGVVCDLNYTTVRRIHLSGNQLVGALPELLLPNLFFLDISNNKIFGALPDWCGLPSLERMHMGSNDITGPLPEWECLTSLSHIYLSVNEIQGALPDWNSLTNLTVISLGSNNITGPLPDWTNLNNLSELRLSRNHITGPLPEWDSLSQLAIISLGGNNITGPLPVWANLTSLSELYASNNQISGALPEWNHLVNLENLQLQNNSLCGTLPQEAPAPSTQLDGENNIFECTVPPDWCLDCNCQLDYRPCACYPQQLICCMNSEYLDSDAGCQPCDPNCAMCQTIATNCTSCAGTWPILDTFQAMCVDACPPGKYYDGAQPAICQSCHGSCANCSISATNCTACNPTGDMPILDELTASCVAKCPVGRFDDGAAAPTCQLCSGSCSECLESATRCTACDLASVTPILDDVSCVSKCPEGKYSDEAVPPKCRTCSSNCLTCSGSSTQCLSCPAATPILLGSSCVSSCPGGQFNQVGACQPCEPPCSSCNGSATQCLACSNDSALLDNSTCVQKCPEGKFDAGEGSCQPCSAPCATCNESAANCLSCRGNAPYLYENECKENCPAGTFADGIASCQPCSANCKTCAGESQTCLSCDPKFVILFEGVCRSTCPAGFSVDGGTCLAAATSTLTSSASVSPSTSSSLARASPSGSFSVTPTTSVTRTSSSTSSPSHTISSTPSDSHSSQEVLPMGPTIQVTKPSLSSAPSSSPRAPSTTRVPNYSARPTVRRTTIGKYIVVLDEDYNPVVMVRPPVGAPEDKLEVMPVDRSQVPTPELLASDAVSLILRNDAEETIQPRGSVQICLPPDRSQAGKDACLGFLDERGSGPPQWKCQDRCLKKKNDLLCGDTDHFTNFALLLTGGNSECEGSYWIFRESWKDGVLLGSFFGAALILIILAIIFSFFPSVSRCVRGQEGYRIHLLRHRNHTDTV